MREDAIGDLTLATALIAIAGFVDAVGFLTLGHLFVSFMSGNSTQFAIAIAGASLSKASMAGGLVGFFVAGVVGGRSLALAAKDWRRPVILIVELALLGAAALVPLSGARPAYLIALAMGRQNAVVHKAGQTAPRSPMSPGRWSVLASGWRTPFVSRAPQGPGFPT